MYERFLFFAEVALPRMLATGHVVIGVRIKRRIEIDEIDTCVGKFFPIGKPAKVVSEIKAIHFRRTARDFSTSVEMTRLHRNYKRMQQLAVSVSGMGSAYSAGYRRLLQSYDGAIRFTIA